MAQNTHKKGHGKHSKAIFSGRSPQLLPRGAPLSTHFEIPIPHLFVVRKVTSMKELQRRLEAGGGVIARRANPDLSGSLDECGGLSGSSQSPQVSTALPAGKTIHGCG
jgi:hypothetical protein